MFHCHVSFSGGDMHLAVAAAPAQSWSWSEAEPRLANTITTITTTTKQTQKEQTPNGSTNALSKSLFKIKKKMEKGLQQIIHRKKKNPSLTGSQSGWMYSSLGGFPKCHPDCRHQPGRDGKDGNPMEIRKGQWRHKTIHPGPCLLFWIWGLIWRLVLLNKHPKK